MEYLTNRIFLDMHTVSPQVSLRVKKADTGRKIYISLREGGRPYQIADDCHAVFSALKPDGNYLYNACQIESNVIVYTFTDQTAAAVGVMDCEVTLYNNEDQVITSPRFTMIVEDRVYNGEEIVSTSEADALKEITDRAEAAAVSAENVVANVTRYVEDNFANAFKGSKAGSLVQVDDVSPVEHIIGCKVKSKNLFNLIDDYRGYDYSYSASDRTLTVTGRYVHKFILLEDGKTYTFSCNSTRTGEDGGGIYIRAYDKNKELYVDVSAGALINQLSPTVTVTLPVGYPYIRFAFYGYFAADGSGTGVYTDIMLEEGKEATGYVPFVDVSTVNLTRCGKNLLPFPYSTTGFNGTYVQLVVNEDRSVTVTGTPTTATQIDLATELILPAGTYCIAGNGSNVRARILGIDGTSRYSVNSFTVADGEKVRIYVVALANEEIDYTFYPMLNVGTEALAYEDYIVQTSEVNAAGTVEGITSLYPSMTLFTDTAATLVSCEYNRDSNKVVAELIKLIGQGGGGSAAARVVDVTILANKWVGTESPYSQVVTVDGATEYSQVDLTPSVEQLSVFHNKDLAFVTENVDGVVTVYAIGQKPTNDYTMQATVTEVVL